MNFKFTLIEILIIIVIVLLAGAIAFRLGDTIFGTTLGGNYKVESI